VSAVPRNVCAFESPWRARGSRRVRTRARSCRAKASSDSSHIDAITCPSNDTAVQLRVFARATRATTIDVCNDTVAGAKLNPTLRAPAAAFLSFAVLGFVFAPSIRFQKFAGIKPVNRLRSPQYRRQDAAEFLILRATMPPERTLRRCFAETHHFLHAAITVRRDDEHRTRQLVPRVNFEEQVMMKLSLRPVVENFVAAKPASHIFKERSQSKILGEFFDNHRPILPQSRRF
jgi:hypothetical protein